MMCSSHGSSQDISEVGVAIAKSVTWSKRDIICIKTWWNIMEYSWIGILSAKDKAINWKALELPLASQIKGLAILQEEGGEVSRCMSGFWTVRLI
jgi:hypothetical protein